MRVVISATSKFHTFDLAREMQTRGALERIFTGYPRFKLRDENLPQELIHPFPYVHATCMALSRLQWTGIRIWEFCEYFDFVTFDKYVASRLPSCDVFVGQSGSSLLTGRAARQRGIRHVCDRGPAHIRAQDQLLREEFERWGIPYTGIDPRVVAREEAEYAEADRITVASSFSLQTFIEQGVPAAKLRRVQYGVNLSQFYPTDAPAADRFDVLFVGAVSLQKGVPYLLQAFQRLQHPHKSLTFAGSSDRELIAALGRHGLSLEGTSVVGHVPKPALKHLISRSHVLVLPSVQDGFGLVLAEAMACGCVVIGTQHTGAPDLVTDTQDGFVVPVRDTDALASRLQYLADHPDARAEMGERALRRVRLEGGWRNYGEQAMSVYREVVS
jgi:glycosyltransferase involved in cell wall biosynthesis